MFKTEFDTIVMPALTAAICIGVIVSRRTTPKTAPAKKVRLPLIAALLFAGTAGAQQITTVTPQLVKSLSERAWNLAACTVEVGVYHHPNPQTVQQLKTAMAVSIGLYNFLHLTKDGEALLNSDHIAAVHFTDVELTADYGLRRAKRAALEFQQKAHGDAEYQKGVLALCLAVVLPKDLPSALQFIALFTTEPGTAGIQQP